MSATTHPGAVLTAPESQEGIVTRPVVRKVFAVARIVIGFTFFWAFLDKLFGFGFATPSSRAWINGGTPAQGFIKGVDGPFHDVHHAVDQGPRLAVGQAHLRRHPCSVA